MRWGWLPLLAVPIAAGLAAVTFAPRSSAAVASVSSEAVASVSSEAVASPGTVASTYRRDCAVCHGGNGEGSDRGPSLTGVGRASVDYYLSTGRMPLDNPDSVPSRHRPRYDAALRHALVDYVWNLTGRGGEDIPHLDLAHADLANGGELFRLNCAACHSWAGTGGALTKRQAPSLAPSTPAQIAEAVRTGPGWMPAFGHAAIDDAQLADLVAYTRYATHPDNRGGLALSHVGPLAEGAVGVFVGVGLLLLFTRWIGTRE
jgi:ubiquinol-cytochrome c reductase cytochrome c subunit